MSEPITIAVEGYIDAEVARWLLHHVGLNVGYVYVKNGKSALDRSLPGYNNAARFSRWLILRDLDEDANCAPALRHTLLSDCSPRMRLHIAVRAVEAWLMADRESLGRFLSIRSTLFPIEPERIVKPKTLLVDLARESRRRAVREAMIPAPKSSVAVGPGYATLLIDYISKHWRPEIAAERSYSLKKIIEFLSGPSGW
jgi:hypothetical protein